jgi:hypothetical protein
LSIVASKCGRQQAVIVIARNGIISQYRPDAGDYGLAGL